MQNSDSQKTSREGKEEGTACWATKLYRDIKKIHFFTALPLVIIEYLSINKITKGFITHIVYKLLYKIFFPYKLLENLRTSSNFEI